MTTEDLVFDADGTPIMPDLLLHAYRDRLFPMAEDREERFRWFRPPVRAVITWDTWRIPRSLKKIAKKQPYRISFDEDFEGVIAQCAERSDTWICRDIERLFIAAYKRGYAHSVEAWRDDELVGGLYGLCIGGCFCGESMFHRADHASKLCVIALVERLQASDFGLLDCQQQTPHMQRFGAYEVTDSAYAALLAQHRERRKF